MRARDLAVGLALVGALSAGFFLANGASPSAPGGQGEPPDVSVIDAALDVGGLNLRVSATPRPITAFVPTRFRVRAEAGTKLAPFDRAEVSFTMSMTMGDHRYKLVPVGDGWWEAQVVLPACASGHKRWYGDLALTVAGEARAARFQFDLEPDAPPGATP
jgi:hypothetical protein